MIGAVAVAGAVVGAGPGRAAAFGSALTDCTPTRGTVVAVSFAHWGGPLVRGCGVDSPNGLQLLHDAGFTSAGTRRDGPAFVCRLGNSAFAGGDPRPSVAEDACNATPPTSASWSFWIALPGQMSWRYSTVGAASDQPVTGAIELWQFGSTNLQGSTGRPDDALVAQLRATASVTATSSAPSTGTSEVAPQAAVPARAATAVPGASGGPAAASSAPATIPTSSTPPVSVPPASAAPTSTGATTAPATNPTTTVISAQPTSSSRDGGSPWPLVGTLALVAVLGGGSAAAALRRRRTARG